MVLTKLNFSLQSAVYLEKFNKHTTEAIQEVKRPKKLESYGIYYISQILLEKKLSPDSANNYICMFAVQKQLENCPTSGTAASSCTEW